MLVGALLDDVLDDDDEELVRFLPPTGLSEWPDVNEWGYKEWSHWLSQHEGWGVDRVKQYIQVDRYKYGLGLRRSEKEPYTWFYLPGPAAIPLHASRTKNILYGGAAGGMKSHSTRWDAYRHCLTIPNYRSIIMRRTFEELKRNHLDRAEGECVQVNKFYGEEVMTLVKTEHELRFLNGSKIVFGHCQNLGDEEKYLGDEYDDFRPDEEATFEQKQIVGVSGRLRSTKRMPDGSRVVARKIGTSNPGGAHTLWLKRWYIDKLVTRQENPKYRPENYQYIPARLYDNPWLMDPDGTYTSYEERLYAYSRERRRQLLNGDWTAITGQFFSEFKEQLHVAVLYIPPGTRIERWIDWGYSPNPGVCHWVAMMPNGRCYVFAEWVFRDTIASEVAKRIDRITKEEVLPATHGRISRSIGDPSMWAVGGHTGESYEETFRRNCVAMVKGDNDRDLGWGRFRHWLAPHPEPMPNGRYLGWVVYHPDCRYAIRTIPALVHDKSNPDDVDTTGEDHAADADRYGFMARPVPTAKANSHSYALPNSVAEMLTIIRQEEATGRKPGQVS